jgi:WD40 repeat protein
MKFSYDKQKYIAKGIPTDEDDNLDIIPGEILERRKTSKSKELPFIYRCKNTIKNFDSEITCLLYLKTVKLIALCTLNPTVELWSLNQHDVTMKIVAILTGHLKTITCLREFLNLNCLASCSLDNTLKLWDISKRECIKTLNYYSKSILTCCYKPSQGMEIFTAGDNR